MPLRFLHWDKDGTFIVLRFHIKVQTSSRSWLILPLQPFYSFQSCIIEMRKTSNISQTQLQRQLQYSRWLKFLPIIHTPPSFGCKNYQAEVISICWPTTESFLPQLPQTPDFPAVLQRWPRECPPPKPFLVPPAVSLPPSQHRLVYRRCYPSPTLSSGLDSEDPAVSWPCTSPAQGFTSQIPNTLAGPGLSDSALRSWITRDKHGCVINDLNEHSLLL